MVNGQGVRPLADRPVMKCGELAYIELFVAGHDVTPGKPDDVIVRFIVPGGSSYGVTCRTPEAILAAVAKMNQADRVKVFHAGPIGPRGK